MKAAVQAVKQRKHRVLDYTLSFRLPKRKSVLKIRLQGSEEEVVKASKEFRAKAAEEGYTRGLGSAVCC